MGGADGIEVVRILQSARPSMQAAITNMRGMVLVETKNTVQEWELPKPEPKSGEVLVEVKACAVCRTDLHVIDGDLPHPKVPLIPGHQIVGHIAGRGPDARKYNMGRSRRDSVVGMDLRKLPILPIRPGKSL
jgi:NADPH:quinone reductase-like Zn-dependent oxidoreductase